MPTTYTTTCKPAATAAPAKGTQVLHLPMRCASVSMPSNGGLLNRNYRYVPSYATNLATTFARIRKAVAAQAAAATAPQLTLPLSSDSNKTKTKEQK